ncbi:MAG: serine/threonine protein kinase [Labilithrix sp.]|nr:serine/threonine protein kinase [Labilithrix sp.]
MLPRVEIVDAQARVVVEGRPRFEPLELLGEGGHGEVTGVRDNDIGRRVALKRLRAAVRSPGAALRFAEEVRTVGQLEHPNIVPIHDVGVDENGDYYFVMKYVDGETLEAIIEKLAAGDARYHARYSFERRVQIFGALLDAVAFAHEKGIVHRDIKPANVMIGAYGEVVLMDWGIAKQKAGERDAAAGERATTGSSRRGTLFETRVGDIVGTPAYMSPEQASSGPVDERSDVYALSLLFHELLCLRHPLDGKSTLEQMLHGVVHEPVPNPTFVSSPHQPATPAELGWFVKKGVEKEPAKRYQSVAEMRDRLARRAEGSFPIQCPITFAKTVLGVVRRFVDRHPLLTTLGVVGSVLSVIAAVVFVAIRAFS